MQRTRSFPLLGLRIGVLVAACLVLLQVVWLILRPGSEGAVLVVGSVAYVLGFPTSAVLDRVHGLLEGPFPVLSSMGILPVMVASILVNWTLVGWAFGRFATRAEGVTPAEDAAEDA